MTAGMTSFLIDTFVCTGLLIALVLLVRRPVSHYFGPQVAYALWALVLLRFLLPPLVLPSWMAPADDAGSGGGPGKSFVFSMPDNVPVEAAPVAGSLQSTFALSPGDVLWPLWLGGAALFLVLRARNYLATRRELMRQARPVGEAGKVLLVETPAVDSPVAFGVRNKVVALPPCFMAHPDRHARDLAIAHELAHHRGHDLLANIAAQPLLALHWFNPLAWWGWRAMRRDQEAACDARVVAGRGRSDRAFYAEIIAGFAAGGSSRPLLAAPMACPMVNPIAGEKSIVHRLRSLTMNEVPHHRRRIGKLAIGAAALGLPLTASISYAAPEVPAAVDARVSSAPALASGALPAPPEAPEPPLAPLAPASGDMGNLSQAPLPPEPPLAPLPPEPSRLAAHGGPGERTTARNVTRRVERRVLLDQGDSERAEREMEQTYARLEREIEELENIDEIVEMAMEEAERALESSGYAIAMASNAAGMVKVEMSCEGDEPVVERDLADGRRSITICTSAINAQAARGLREARREISRQRDLPDEQRESVLRHLDRQIERMTARQVSSLIEPARGVPMRAVAFVTASGAEVAGCDSDTPIA